MTSVLSKHLPSDQMTDIPVGRIGEARLLANLAGADLSAHRETHGQPMPLSRSRLLGYLDAVNLTGRGGASFPFAHKIRALPEEVEPIVVVNAAEGEPASAKDHALLRYSPHLIADGAAVAATAVGARKIIIAVTDRPAGEITARAIAMRPDAASFTVRLLPDTFITGEARALVRALSGGPAVPPGRRTPATEQGVDGIPTLLSNAETFAQLGVLARIGPQQYATSGSHDEPGTTLITATGAVASPGVLEVPYGIDLLTVAAAVGARPSQAVVIGGYHGIWHIPDPSLVLSKRMLGAGAVVFVGDQTCPLAELTRVTEWLAAQSATQCGPCMFGLPALANDVAALSRGSASAEVAARHARLVTGRGACAHPDGAARFVRSALGVLAEEIGVHDRYRDCRRVDRGDLSLTRAAAFVRGQR